MKRSGFSVSSALLCLWLVLTLVGQTLGEELVTRPSPKSAPLDSPLQPVVDPPCQFVFNSEGHAILKPKFAGLQPLSKKTAWIRNLTTVK